MTAVVSSHFEDLGENPAERSELEFTQISAADSQLLDFHDRLVWDSLNWRQDRHDRIGALDEDPLAGEALLHKRAVVLIDFIENGNEDQLREYIPTEELDILYEQIVGRTALKLVSVS